MNTPRVTSIITEMIQTYLDKKVSRTAASLAYFLMLSIFPTLICLYAMLGRMFPTVAMIEELTKGLLPTGTIETIVEYLGYITSNNSAGMISAAVIVMATTSAGAYRTLHNAMGEITGGTRYKGLWTFLFSFLFSLLFLAAMYFAVIVIITGGWFINLVEERISFFSIEESWEWMRFILLLALLFVIIYGVYRMTAPRGGKMPLLSGAVLAAVVLEIVSIIFSVFISMSSRYPLVYGSLASVMILMLWLYLCGNILILGNIFNVALYNHK